MAPVVKAICGELSFYSLGAFGIETPVFVRTYHALPNVPVEC